MRIASEDLLKEYQIGHLFPDFPDNFTPPWILDPNYVEPTRQPVMYATIGITTLAMCIVVIARLTVRSHLKKSVWGLDDWLIIPAFLLTLGMIVCEIYSIKVGGVGRHSYNLSWAELCLDYRTAFVIFMFYIWSTLFTKLSIIAFYYRLAGPTKSRIQRILTPLVIWCVSLTTTTMFLSVFGFKPIQAGWDLNYKLKPFTALPAHSLWVALSAVYTVTDIFILIIPMPLVWNLQMRTGRKIKICLVFSLGGVACVAIAVRTFYLHRVYESFDPTYGGYIITIADQLETTIAIIAASLPALSALLNSMCNSGVIVLLGCWSAITGKSRSYPTVSSVIELEHKEEKDTRYLSENSSDRGSNNVSLSLQQGSTPKRFNSNPSKHMPRKSWANRNVLNISTYDDSQMQSTLNNSVDLEDCWPLRNDEVTRTHPTGSNPVTAYDNNFVSQSFGPVIQDHENDHDPWAEVERRYLKKH